MGRVPVWGGVGWSAVEGRSVRERVVSAYAHSPGGANHKNGMGTTSSTMSGPAQDQARGIACFQLVGGRRRRVCEAAFAWAGRLF